jgi:hypothetical protein
MTAQLAPRLALCRICVALHGTTRLEFGEVVVRVTVDGSFQFLSDRDRETCYAIWLEHKAVGRPLLVQTWPVTAGDTTEIQLDSVGDDYP